MNKNLLIGLIIVLLVTGGVLIANNTKTNPSSITSDSEQAQTDESMQVKKPETETDAMEAQENVVTLTESGFEPKEITVTAGDKVVWVNNSGTVATVDSSKHPTHLDYPELNLGRFEDGQEHEFVFDTPGTYFYHDHLNSSRFGSVVVK